MGRTTNENPVSGIIVALQVFLSFIMGITGDKIADILEIPPIVLFAFTGVGLIVLTLINYINFSNIPATQTQPDTSSKFFKLLIPRTMIDMFRFGIFLGMMCGGVPAFISKGLEIEMPTWVASIFGEGIVMTSHEFRGVLFGSFTGILFAVIVDGHLGGGLLIGYGVGLATGTVLSQHLKGAFYTYLGHGSYFGILGLILVVSEPILGKIREFASKPRI